ncbi:MAG TPA: hypothetical protein DCM08_04655, partial [Microscillaceae bacterium]|nr:hypothetical protein [Microscillaceae bacterium]
MNDPTAPPAHSATHIILSLQVAFFSAALALTNLMAGQIGDALDVGIEKKLSLFKQLQKSQMQEVLLEGRLLTLQVLTDAKQDKVRDTVLMRKTLQSIQDDLQQVRKKILALQVDDSLAQKPLKYYLAQIEQLEKLSKKIDKALFLFQFCLTFGA